MMTASGMKKRSAASKISLASCHASEGYEPKSTHCVYHGNCGCVATWKMYSCGQRQIRMVYKATHKVAQKVWKVFVWVGWESVRKPQFW